MAALSVHLNNGMLVQPYSPEIGYDYSVVYLPKDKHARKSSLLHPRSYAAASGFLMGSRRIYNLAKNVVRSEVVVDFLGKIAETVHAIFDILEGLMRVTQISFVIRLIQSPIRLVNKIAKMKKSTGWKLFDHSMAALQSLRIISLSLSLALKFIEPYQATLFPDSPVWQSVFRIAAVVAPPLAAVGAVLSFARFVGHARHCWKIYQYTREFDRLVETSQAETDDRIKYAAIHRFLVDTKRSMVRRAFKIDNDLFRSKIPQTLDGHFDCLRMEELLPVLRGRLSSTLRHHILILLADAVYCVGAGLILADVGLAVGNACKGIFGVWLLGSGGYQFWSSRQFVQVLKST